MDDWEGHTCDSIGIGGNCGLDCPVLLRGDCESEDEMYEDINKPSQYYAFDKAMEILK